MTAACVRVRTIATVVKTCMLEPECTREPEVFMSQKHRTHLIFETWQMQEE
jgi:hypothetical protein